jgi:hypothetical protein
MLAKRMRQQKGFLSKGHKSAATLRLPGALSLSGSELDGRSEIPRRCPVTSPRLIDEEMNLGVHVGKRKDDARQQQTRTGETEKVKSLSQKGSLSGRTSETSRSESNRARPSRESGRDSSTRISPSNRYNIVLPHESAL